MTTVYVLTYTLAGELQAVGVFSTEAKAAACAQAEFDFRVADLTDDVYRYAGECRYWAIGESDGFEEWNVEEREVDPSHFT